MLNDKEQAALMLLADALNVPSLWLDKLISFESRWNPKAQNIIKDKNGKVLSAARGLIQFTDTTARGMGFKDSLDLVNKYPTRAAQLQTPVYNYLKKLAPFPTEQALYMSVFYPAAKAWPENKEFSPTVQAYNPGIKTVADYVRKVNGSKVINTLTPYMLLAIVALGIFLLSNKQPTERGYSWHNEQTGKN